MRKLIFIIGVLLCVLFVGFTVPAHTGPNPNITILWVWVPGCLLILGVTYFLSRTAKK